MNNPLEFTTDSLDASSAGEHVGAAVSDINFSLQGRLVERLHEALDRSGRTTVEVATILGVDEEVVKDIRDGEYELSISELIEYAYAVDALVDIRILPGARNHVKTFYDSFKIRAAQRNWTDGTPKMTSRHARQEARRVLAELGTSA